MRHRQPQPRASLAQAGGKKWLKYSRLHLWLHTQTVIYDLQAHRVPLDHGGYLNLALRLIAAAILAQTLFFKFSGAEESVFIFQTLGAEPWGRLGSGVAELICVVLLLIPGTAWLGALGAAVVGVAWRMARATRASAW